MMKHPARLISIVCVLASMTSAVPVWAQSGPAISARPFFLYAQQRFAAKETFDAAFGGTSQPFLGVGGQLVFDRVFVDVTISRFSKDGERAFHLEDENFGLGIPLKATMTPIEIAAGLRFPVGTARTVFPYLGAGIGSYKFTESSDFDDEGDAVSLRHSGYLVLGGVEFRLHPWISATADVQFTSVTGIFGGGGVSEQADETNAGGVSARFRVMIGR